MKTITRITLFIAAVLLVAVTSSMAQRVIKGTVYMDGEPAAGITVEVHKGGTMMTSFDGMYKVEADAKSKWIKFTFIDETQKLNLEDYPGDKIDHAFTGKLPSEGDEDEATGDVILKTMEELMQEQDKDYMNELSLYTEFYKQEDYKSAIPYWRNIYNKYPKSHLNVYIQGGKILEDLVEKAANDEEKDKALNNLMKLYDKRVKYFGQKGYVLGRKGTTWLKYKIVERDNALEGEALKEALKVGYGWVMEAMTDQGDDTEPTIVLLVMQTTRSLFKLGELPKETVISNYDKCNSILNSYIAKNDDPTKVKEVKEVIQPYIENLFGTSGAADCEALTNIFAPQFREKSNDIEFIKSMLSRLGRAKCSDSQLFSDATEKLYELEPSAEAAFNMARRYINRDDAKAKDYYKQAMDQETNQELLADYYFEYARFLYAKENAYSEARNYARKALDINPDYCEANMLIGDIYVASSRSFSGTKLEKAAVFWAAVDYYNKARRGEDCSIDAAQKASNYRKYFPGKEDAFMEGLQEGQTYNVGGWINENTKIRF